MSTPKTISTVVILVILCILTSCSNNSKPSIVVAATMANGVSTVCVKGTGYTSNGGVRITMLMPPYTINGSAGPNPIANAPFGTYTASPSGTYQQKMNLGGSSQAVCTGTPSQPVLFLVDQTTLGVGAAGIPPGFMCGNLPAPPPFGDQSACQ